ncbi:unnamed protein product, partial [Mesorhabditis belari]|uniref:Uncharacterized protein n=1 Tax=Mesorhabditis belari TaxID=2138241 RepID=A0AAF3EQN1_9BILA
MSGVIDKTKEAVSNAAEAVKDKYHGLTGQKEEHKAEAKEQAGAAWEQAKDKMGATKDKACDKSCNKTEEAKDFTAQKLHQAGRNVQAH